MEPFDNALNYLTSVNCRTCRHWTTPIHWCTRCSNGMLIEKYKGEDLYDPKEEKNDE